MKLRKRVSAILQQSFITLNFLILNPMANAAKLERHVLILGDSITEGLGVNPDEAFPAQLQLLLNQSNHTEVLIHSAGISGSTSAGGMARLKWALKSTWKPTELALELGANDGLRGRAPAEIKKDLKATIEFAKMNHLPVLLLGMKMPYNLPSSYRADYEAVFSGLAKSESISFMPFLLESVAGNSTLNQADGIHPTSKGHKKVAESLYPYLIRFLNL